jgi:hypothetical protein
MISSAPPVGQANRHQALASNNPNAINPKTNMDRTSQSRSAFLKVNANDAKKSPMRIGTPAWLPMLLHISNPIKVFKIGRRKIVQIRSCARHHAGLITALGQNQLQKARQKKR